MTDRAPGPNEADVGSLLSDAAWRMAMAGVGARSNAGVRRWRAGLGSLSLALLTVGGVFAGAPGDRTTGLGNVPRDSVLRVGPGVYRVGQVTIDAAKREVTIPGRVNMSSGVVELLACATRGKTHESVLVLDSEPYHIQVGLLLLGLEPTRRALKYQGDPATPTGDSVEVTVSWVDSLGHVRRVRGEDLILDLRTRKSMSRTPWVFVGSRVIEGRFEAQEEGSIITTYHDPATLVDNPLSGGGDDTVYGANSEIVPRVGTPVTVTIRALTRPHATTRKN